MVKYVNQMIVIMVIFFGGVAHGAIITVGNHEVPGGTVTPIQIRIEREASDPAIVGMDLAIAIEGDGGLALGVIDLVTDTPFAGNYEAGGIDQGSDPRHAFWGIITASGGVPIGDSDVLATVEIDATGVRSGTFDLRLTSVLGVDTQIYGADLSLVTLNQGQPITGTVNVFVPEPASIAWITLVVILGSRRAMLRR